MLHQNDVFTLVLFSHQVTHTKLRANQTRYNLVSLQYFSAAFFQVAAFVSVKRRYAIDSEGDVEKFPEH